jgi:membrane-bound lytic murein transglycosylase MltF
MKMKKICEYQENIGEYKINILENTLTQNKNLEETKTKINKNIQKRKKKIKKEKKSQVNLLIKS